MRILFLDDSPERTAKFKAAYAHAVCVETAAECIEKLKGEPWMAVCLDHDLGGRTFDDSSRADCGMEVVRWLMRNPCNIGRIIVHTWNEPAGRRMVSDLRRRDYNAIFEPFGLGEWVKRLEPPQ